MRTAPVTRLPIDWFNDDVNDLRRKYEAERARPIPSFAHWQSFETSAGAIRVLVHEPKHPSGSGKVIVYFHGGDFLFGSPATHADITTALCQRTGCPVYSVDYRLAPEHAASAAIEDGLAVIAALARDDQDSRFVISGDSAGAAIAMAVEAAAPRILKTRIAGVCGFYGAYGFFDAESHRLRGRRADGTDLACRQRYWRLAHGGSGESPYAISALDRASSVPVYFLAGDIDALCDDTLVLAETLEQRGRAVTIDLAAGEDHGFLHRASTDASASRAMDWVNAWISDL